MYACDSTLMQFVNVNKRLLFAEFTAKPSVITLKHRLSPYNTHCINYNFFTRFSVPVPCEYEIKNYF